MRCTRCGERAVVELRRHNAACCPECFILYFERQVTRAIRNENMLSHQEPVLVAVSGGKDSLALWDVLLRLGYTAAGLHIDLGIGSYSALSRQHAMAFAEARGAPLTIISIEESFGCGVDDMRRRTRRHPCSACGLIKRYYFNKAAREGGFPVLATGHNLDDEAATLMGNVLHWATGYLARQHPMLSSTHPRLVRKAKPLYRVAERETAAYAVIRGIDYVLAECPLAEGARSLLYKDALNVIEARSPGAKQSFYHGFLERARGLFHESEAVELGECERCGQPTTLPACAFCRLQEEVRSKSPRPHRAMARPKGSVAEGR